MTTVIQTPSLLALHARAISLRGTSRAAWARLDTYRAEHSASGYGWGNTGGETERAEDDALRAAFNAAEKAEHDSIADLCAAVRAAEWGPQPDGSFVARHASQIGRMPDVHTLHAPAKQGPLCEVRDHERGPGSRLVALRTREEARAIRAVERAANATRQAVYEANRQEAGAILRRGGTLPYCPGQEYGFVEIPSGARVAARGALIASGMTREEAVGWLTTQDTSRLLESPMRD